MTGAQERAVLRLRRKHSNVAVNSTPDPTQDVIASWPERDVVGEPRRVIVTITPEGRVVERPS